MPRPFTLDRDFIQEIRDLVPAEPLDEILADYDTWRNERPRELCRKVVIELLAWQFASPVRWIETQDLLFIEEAAGGLGVERFVEIGVKSAPTVAGPGHQHAEAARVLAQHNGSAQLRARRRGAVRDRHRPGARARGRRRRRGARRRGRSAGRAGRGGARRSAPRRPRRRAVRGRTTSGSTPPTPPWR